MTTTPHTTSVSRRQKVGLALAGLISLGSIPSVLSPTPDGQVGPPSVVLWADTVLGVVGIVAVIIAWRHGSRGALRVLAGALIIAALTTLPAFFVDIPIGIKALAAASVLLTVAAVVLMFSSSRRPSTVTD
ncbi:MAG: hypothetical protein ABIU87_07120 [Ornithinibacter sp.]